MTLEHPLHRVLQAEECWDREPIWQLMYCPDEPMSRADSREPMQIPRDDSRGSDGGRFYPWYPSPPCLVWSTSQNLSSQNSGRFLRRSSLTDPCLRIRLCFFSNLTTEGTEDKSEPKTNLVYLTHTHIFILYIICKKISIIVYNYYIIYIYMYNKCDFEISFTTYFGEIEWTQKNPKVVYREKSEREREREKKHRENKGFFIFFQKNPVKKKMFPSKSIYIYIHTHTHKYIRFVFGSDLSSVPSIVRVPKKHNRSRRQGSVRKHLFRNRVEYWVLNRNSLFSNSQDTVVKGTKDRNDPRLILDSHLLVSSSVLNFLETRVWLSTV
jgi:hypothetical protein